MLFFITGKKKYCISYTNDAGYLKTMTKISGLSHDSEATSHQVDEAKFAVMLKNYIKEEKNVLKVSQIRRMAKGHDVCDKKVSVSFGNNLNFQRNINLKSKNLITYPYGWRK